MFRFDWLSFIKAHKIPYVTSGPNTAKNHISIKCCWCGNDDPSEHLGLSLNENAPAWGCLRNQKHRGQNVMFLVQKLRDNLGIEAYAPERGTSVELAC